MKVNQQQLASVFGVTPRTIRRWRSDGMPASGDRTYRTDECIEWLVEREVERATPDVEEELDGIPPEGVSKRIREHVRARRAEMRLARERGELVTREAHEEVVAELTGLVARDLKQAPGRYGAQLGFDDPRRGEKVMREITSEMLARFSGETADRIETGDAAAELPEGFPARRHLARAGVETLAEVRVLARFGGLSEVPEIGSARAAAIREALDRTRGAA